MPNINRDIIIISKNLENHKRIETLFSLIGYKPYFVEDINKLFGLMEKFIPFAIVIVEEKDIPLETYAREIKRFAPLIYIIALQKESSILTREKLLENFDYVIPSPWTDIELIKALKINENSKKIGINEKEKKIDKKIISITVLFIVALSVNITFFIPQKNEEANKQEKISIPKQTISGFYTKDDKLYIYDWILQSFYVYNKNNLQTIENFITPFVISNIKDGNDDFFFIINDENEIEKRIKNEKFNLISKIKYDEKIVDICFDKMYVWILTENSLIKSINNDTLTQLEKYDISNIKPKYLGCDKYEILYYTTSKIYKATTEKPTQIQIYKTSPNVKVIAFDYKNSKIRYIYTQNNKSYFIEE